MFISRFENVSGMCPVSMAPRMACIRFNYYSLARRTAAIGNIIVSGHEVKTGQCIWRSGTRRWNVWVPDLPMGYFVKTIKYFSWMLKPVHGAIICLNKNCKHVITDRKYYFNNFKIRQFVNCMVYISCHMMLVGNNFDAWWTILGVGGHIL